MSNTERKYGMHWIWAYVIFKMVNTFASEFVETWMYSQMDSISAIDEWIRMLTSSIWLEAGMFIVCKALWCLLTRKRYGGSSGWRWYTLGLLGIVQPILNTVVNVTSFRNEFASIGMSDMLSVTSRLVNIHMIAAGVIGLVLSLLIYRAALKSYIKHIVLLAMCSDESDD